MQKLIENMPAILTALAVLVGALATAFVTLFRKIGSMQEDVKKIELATNSMKDALVKATDEAADTRGQLTGVANEQARVAGLAAVAATKAEGELAGVTAEQARIAAMVIAEATVAATEGGAVIPGSRTPQKTEKGDT